MFIIVMLFGGCFYVSDRGVGPSRYVDCEEGYNAAGEYYKECDGEYYTLEQLKQDLLCTDDKRKCEDIK